MTDGSEWERPSTSSAPVPHESDVSNDVRTNDVHTVGKARGPVELVGLMLVIGAATFDLGQAIAAKDYQFNESAGDYFVYMTIWQIFADLFVTLGVSLCVAPRLFLRSGAGQPRGVATGGAVVGAVVAMAAAILSSSALIVAIARASADELDYGAGDVISHLGMALIALAVVGLAFWAVSVLRQPDRNAIARPVV